MARMTTRFVAVVLGAAAVLVLLLANRADAESAPRAPTLRAADEQVTVRWSFPDADEVRVWRDGELVHTAAASPGEWVDRSVTNGQRYVYRVDHLDGGVRSPRSSPASATPAPRHYRDTGPAVAEAANWAALDPDGPNPPVVRYANGLFRGDRLLSRGEAAGMLFRLFGRPDHEGRGQQFDDVPPALRNAVAWITKPPFRLSVRPMVGYADDTFRPGRAITRGQLARALYVLNGIPATIGDDPDSEVLSTLDLAEQLLRRHGVMSVGTPSTPVTRAQAVRILHRFDHWRAARRAQDLPAGEWRPPEGATPTTGSYWYLDSTSLDDFIGQAGEYVFTPSNSRSSYSEDDIAESWRFSARVHGEDDFDIHLVGPAGQADPGPGLVVDDGGHATYPSISVGGRGHGCGQDGWYDVVEHEVDTDGTVLAWTVRFEARCFEDDSPPLRGEIHYDADDPVAPPTPGPIPDDLWQPDPTSIPAEGTVVHLESSPGEWIVQREVTLTPSNSDLEVEARPPHRSATARVEVSTRTPSFWNGRFSGNWTMDQLQPGFYPDTNRSPFQNPAEGGIDWSGEGRGCNTIDGWLAVDEISYAEDGTLDHLVLRFQQHCGNRYQGFDPPLRGYVRYDRPAPAP